MEGPFVVGKLSRSLFSSAGLFESALPRYLNTAFRIDLYYYKPYVKNVSN